MEPQVREQVDTHGETAQGPISTLRALADNAFPEEVKVAPSREEDDGSVQKNKQGT